MKPPIPKIELDWSDVPDIFSLSPEELAQVPGEQKWWTCCAANCVRRTKVIDYGAISKQGAPKVYWRKQWINLAVQMFYCGKHYPLIKRMIKEKREHEFNFKPTLEINILT